MPTIRKRNDKFQAQVRRAGCQTISRTFHRRKDALEWAHEMELKADRRGMPQNLKALERTTLADMLKQYRETVIPHKRSPENETIILNAFLKQDICRKSLAEITSEDFEKYKIKRLKTVLGSTINREFNIIRHAYNTAINVWEMPIAKNPLTSVPKAPTPHSRTRRLSAEEHKKLMEHAQKAQNPYINAIITFALETALRRGEILNMTYEHLNLEKRTLHIPNTKTGYPRTIPLSSKAIAAIPKKRKKGRIFPVETKAFEYHWRNICTKAAIEGLNFHDLRHEAISRFFERGLSIPEVSLISGHRDYRMLARYTHLKAEDIVRKL